MYFCTLFRGVFYHPKHPASNGVAVSITATEATAAAATTTATTAVVVVLSWLLFVCGTAAAATSPQSLSNKSQSLLANGGKATSLYRHLNCTLNP